MGSYPPLEEALRQLDLAFDPKLPRLEVLCVSCSFSKRGEPEELARHEHFEAIVRTHRRARLTLPIELLVEESFGHGSALVHGNLRRFAWFVPSLLASASRLGVEVTMRRLAGLAFEARRAEQLYRPQAPRALSLGERTALTAFFVVALRPGEVLDRGSWGDVASAFAAAAACGCDSAVLVASLRERWDRDPQSLAVIEILRDLDPRWTRRTGARFDVDVLTSRAPESLTQAMVDGAFRELLFTEETRSWLEARCLGAPDPTASAAFSAAEQIVRDAL